MITLVRSKARLVALAAALAAFCFEVGVGARANPNPFAPPYSDIAALGANTPAGWAVGPKRVLFLRIDFPDATNTGPTESFLTDALRAASDYFQIVSQGRTSLTGTVLPQVLRVSQPRSYYIGAPGGPAFELQKEVLPLARAYDQAHGGAGTYNPDACDRWVIVYDLPGASAGLGNIGIAGIWVDSVSNGVAFPNVLAHELGHNYGLFHSHGWRPSGSSPIGAGVSDEYADRFDLMGSGSYPMLHLNAPQKFALGYLDETAIARLTTPGVYRLYRHDHASADGTRALVIDAGDYDFWLEHRQEVANIGTIPELIDRFKHGVFVHWNKHPSSLPGGSGALGPYLLDMTPGSIYDFSDAPLAVGETFANAPAGFSITPVGVGGTAPREYIDVRVDFTTPTTPPVIVSQPPLGRANNLGGTVTLSATINGSPPPTIQWQQNGVDLATSNSATLTLAPLQPSHAGLYRASATNIYGSVVTDLALVGVLSGNKVAGSAAEVGPNLVHPNGNVYDQLLLQGAAAAITADAGQVSRISYVDLNDDIVQVEMSGRGTLALVLDAASTPAPPAKYNQPGVSYVKGHAGIVVANADETTNLSVFTVGKITAVNAALFRDDVTYDGVADLAFIAILSGNGRFGGLRAANVNFFATRGCTGIYAPNASFEGPVYLHDIDARDTASPVLILGASTDVRVAGGELHQTNGAPIAVAGFTQLKFTAGSTSGGAPLPAQRNAGRLESGGRDVTAQVVVNPSP